MAPRPRTFVYNAPPKPPRPKVARSTVKSPADVAKLTRVTARGLQQGREYKDGEVPFAILAAAKAMIGRK